MGLIYGACIFPETPKLVRKSWALSLLQAPAVPAASQSAVCVCWALPFCFPHEEHVLLCTEKLCRLIAEHWENEGSIGKNIKATCKSVTSGQKMNRAIVLLHF